jgi:hypothetical protein
VRLRIFYLVLSKVFACNALVPTRLADPLMSHVNPTFRGFAYVAFGTKLEFMISESCANIYLWHHFLAGQSLPWLQWLLQGGQDLGS